MEITFLGTGTSQGVPVIACECEVCLSQDPRDKRLRTSVMVSDNQKNVVIDTGPDFRQQMLREKVVQLEGVVFTHEHKDHIAGLDDIRAFNYHTGQAVDVYASARVEEALRREYAYIFEEIQYPGVPQIRLHTIGNSSFLMGGLTFDPIEVLHYRLPVLGFRINDFVYVTDANFIGEQEKEKMKHANILVLNALRKQRHISHFSLEEALLLIEELSPKAAYLTHISHQLGKHEEVQDELPANVFLAYDGLRLNC